MAAAHRVAVSDLNLMMKGLGMKNVVWMLSLVALSNMSCRSRVGGLSEPLENSRSSARLNYDSGPLLDKAKTLTEELFKTNLSALGVEQSDLIVTGKFREELESKLVYSISITGGGSTGSVYVMNYDVELEKGGKNELISLRLDKDIPEVERRENDAEWYQVASAVALKMNRAQGHNFRGNVGEGGGSELLEECRLEESGKAASLFFVKYGTQALHSYKIILANYMPLVMSIERVSE